MLHLNMGGINMLLTQMEKQIAYKADITGLAQNHIISFSVCHLRRI